MSSSGGIPGVLFEQALPAGPSGWTLIPDAADLESSGTARLMEIPLSDDSGFVTVFQDRFEGDLFPRFVLVSDGSYYVGNGTYNPLTGPSAGIAIIPSFGAGSAGLMLQVGGHTIMNVPFNSDTPSFSAIDVAQGVTIEQILPPAAPLTGNVTLFCEDAGAGKAKLSAKFHTGAVQVIATEP